MRLRPEERRLAAYSTGCTLCHGRSSRIPPGSAPRLARRHPLPGPSNLIEGVAPSESFEIIGNECVTDIRCSGDSTIVAAGVGEWRRAQRLDEALERLDVYYGARFRAAAVLG